MMDVVLYMRYSSDRQNEQSIEGQHRICKQFCEANGYNIVDVYIDRALSAFHDTAKRIDFQRMIADSEKRQWQGVVVYKLDRFARNRYDSATYKAKLKKNGVRVISATENISDNPEGVLLESVLEGMAEFYSKELSQKIRRGMNESAHKCNTVGGNIPLGYKVKDKKLIIDPTTAPIVQEAFEMYANGDTVAHIIEVFNSKGYRTSKGSEFNKNSFKSMFKNERYIGKYCYKDMRIDGGVPTIVTMEQWDAVQARLKENAKAPARGKAKVDYMLSGKLFCGHCGKPMNGDTGTSKTGAKHYYYNCYGRKVLKNCKKKQIQKDYIEYIVAQKTMELLNPETIEYLADIIVAENEKELNKNSIVPALEDKLKETERAIHRLLKLVEKGADSPSLSQRLNELERERRDYEKRIIKETEEDWIIDKPMIIYWFNQLLEGDLETEEGRRHIIDMFVNSVFVYDNDDGTTTLDIAYNTTSGKHDKVVLSDLDKSSVLGLKRPPKEYNPNFFYYIVRKRLFVINAKIPNRV